jgi:hypothetical protein
VLNCDPLPLQKRHSACDEVGLSTAAISTNVSVKDLLYHIAIATTTNSSLMWINRIDDRKGARRQRFD